LCRHVETTDFVLDAYPATWSFHGRWLQRLRAVGIVAVSGVPELGVNRFRIEPRVGPCLHTPDEITADKCDMMADAAVAGLAPVHVHGDPNGGERVVLLALESPPCRPNAPAKGVHELGYLARGMVPCHVVTDVPM
jgi:hypothetical protein